MKIKNLLLNNPLILILLVAALLRLYKLGSIPPHLSPDEAALGYNAFSILKTGRDEYGEFLPLIFKSFGDYKPGLYVYLTLPFIAIFGLNEFAVRLPSAISGIVSVLLIYLIGKAIFNFGKTGGKKVGFFSAFAASVNPWMIYFSRGAWEANICLTLSLAGIYCFLLSLKKSKFLVPTSLLFGSTLLTYQGAKLSTPIILVILFTVFGRKFWNKFRSRSRKLLQSSVFLVIVLTPIFLSLLTGKTGRLSVFSVFSYPRPEEYTKEFLMQGNESAGSLKYFLFHSESLNFVRGILGRWFNHFSARFLFSEGDYQNPRHSAPNHGMLLLSDLFLIPLGLIFLLRRKSKFSVFVLLFLVLSPLPAVLSRDQVQSVRAINMSTPLVFLSGSGLYWIYRRLKEFNLRSLWVGAHLSLFTTIFASLVYFTDSYFVHLPIHNSKYWQYGYKQVVESVIPIQDSYEKILFQQSYSQPYIYFLFYGSQIDSGKYDPIRYQSKSEINIKGSDVGLIENLDNISFEEFSWPPPLTANKMLIVGDSVAVPPNYPIENFRLISEIKYPDGINTAFRVLEKTNNE